MHLKKTNLLYWTSTRWLTWHIPDDKYHSQIDYIFARKYFWTGVDIARTGILLLMTFKLQLKSKKWNQIRIRFDIHKLKEPGLLQAFGATVEWEICPYNHLGCRKNEYILFHTLLHSWIYRYKKNSWNAHYGWIWMYYSEKLLILTFAGFTYTCSLNINYIYHIIYPVEPLLTLSNNNHLIQYLWHFYLWLK